MTRRRVFVGSSGEAVKSGAVQLLIDNLSRCLGDEFKVILWKNTPWKNLTAILDTLQVAANHVYDYAIFVFWPDDEVKIGGIRPRTTIKKGSIPLETYQTRDNVLFEFGLFLGELGKERTFILVPQIEGAQFHLLSDIGDSLSRHNYKLVKRSRQFEPRKGSIIVESRKIANEIKNHVRQNSELHKTESNARKALQATVGKYRNDLFESETEKRSEWVMLNCAKRYIGEFLAFKATINHHPIADVTDDLAEYYDKIDDILNVRQLAEKQLIGPSNRIREVWVFADHPLEFLRGHDLTPEKIQLQKTIATNINEGVKYVYIVNGGFDEGKIENGLVKFGARKRNIISNVKVIKVRENAFKTYFTIHKFNAEDHAYMSALMKRRNDLLIRIKDDHAQKVVDLIGRLTRALGDEDSERMRVRDLSEL